MEPDLESITRFAELRRREQEACQRAQALLEPRHRCRVVQRLGSGGLAEVYFAEGPSGEPLALKLLREPLEPWRIERLERIWEHLHSLPDRGLLALPLKSGRTSDGRLYYLLPHFPCTLRDLPYEELQTRTRLEILLRLARGLELLHSHGIVHRDIKPANLLVRQTEGEVQVAITDLDFAHRPAVEPSLTRDPEAGLAQRPFGTWPYAPPEAWPPMGPLSCAWDIWSFGMTAHELLAGGYPFRASIEGKGSEALLDEYRRVCGGELPLSLQLEGHPLEGLVRQTLHRAPPQERPTAGQIVRKLEEVLGDKGPLPQTPRRSRGQEPTPRFAGRPPARTGRGRAAALAASAAVLVLAAALSWRLWSRSPADLDLFVRRHLALDAQDAVERVLQEDWTGDGVPEAAAAVYRKTRSGPHTRVVLLSAEGQPLWERALGRELVFGQEVYTATYWPAALLSARLASAGRGLVVTSLHTPWWPAQVLLLDARSGSVVAEYIHGGPVFRTLVEDLDQDGADEILLAATNKLIGETGPGRGAAVLAVLEARPFRGRSPGVPEPVGLDLPAGQERAYLRFPLSDVGAQLLSGPHFLDQLLLPQPETKRRFVLARAREESKSAEGGSAGLMYELDAETLAVSGVSSNAPFAVAHAKLLQAGRLTSTLDRRYYTELAAHVRFGRFEAVKRIGSGGLGEVILALDPDFTYGPLVAVKTLREDLGFTAARQAELQERFLAEGWRMAELRHPGIVKLHETGERQGRPFLVLEYLELGDLNGWIQRHPAARPEQALELFEAVLGALEHAHEKLWHGDLSPRNVLFGREERPKLGDFGMAHELPRAGRGMRTMTGLQQGTRRYAAPEQLRDGRGGPRSDLFAAGVLLHEVLSRCEVGLGRRQHDRVVELMRRACAAEPRHRYATAEEMAGALRRALWPAGRRGRRYRLAPLGEGLAPEAAIGELRPVGSRGSGRRAAVRVLALVVGLGLGVAGYWLGTQPEADPETFFRRRYRLAAEEHLRNPINERVAGPVLAADLDGKEGAELVALIQKNTNEGTISRVVVLGPEGRLRWKRRLGRELRFEQDVYTTTFSPERAEVLRLAGGRPGLAVISNQTPWWPSQLLVLDGASGEVMAEYIHAGHLHPLAVLDTDGDGSDEIVGGGVNNKLQPAAKPGYTSAVVAVLGTHAFRGRSPGVPQPEGLELPLAQERAYLRFPYSDVAHERLWVFHAVTWLETRRYDDGSAVIEANTTEIKTVDRQPGGGLYYSLDAKTLLPRGVGADSNFPQVHGELVREGKLSSRLDEAYFEALMAGIRYWDGRQWLTPEEWGLRLGGSAGGSAHRDRGAAPDRAVPFDP